MVGLFVRLKLRLLRNVLRTPGGAGLIVFTLVSWFAGFMAALATRNIDGDDRLVVAPLFGAIVVAGWLLSPLLFGANDETIDTSRLVLFTLEPKRLASGMAAASVVGPGSVAAALPLLGLAVAAPTIGHQALAAVAALATIVMATTASRLALTALGASLRRRRSRDLATVIAGLSVGIVGVAGQVLAFLDLDLSIAGLAGAADVVGLTPFGWTGNALGRASNGEVAAPLVLLASSGLLIVVMLRMWVDVLARVLTEAEETEGSVVHGGHLLRETAPRADRVGWAVLAKERRYLSRHPRYRVQVLSQVTVLIIGGAPFIEAILARDQSAVLLGSIPGLTAGITGSNLLGPDGRALWAETLALRSLRPLIRGRSLAFVGLGIILAAFLSVGVAAWTGGWRYVPVALGAAIGMAFIGAGVGSFTSTMAFASYPDDATPNPFASASPGNGCLNGIITFAGVLVGLALSMPIVLGLGAADESLLVAAAVGGLGPVAGIVIWLTGTHLAGRRADRRTPEIVAALGAL